jgi:hypothetical protein
VGARRRVGVERTAYGGRVELHELEAERSALRLGSRALEVDGALPVIDEERQRLPSFVYLMEKDHAVEATAQQDD